MVRQNSHPFQIPGHFYFYSVLTDKVRAYRNLALVTERSQGADGSPESHGGGLSFSPSARP